MVAQQKRLEEIMKFVRENPKRTKVEVITHLKDLGLASIMTTHYDIKYLVDEGKITVLKDKPNSQTHYLIINDKNDFNRIDEKLAEIEKFIDRMNEPLSKTSAPYYLQELKITDKETAELRSFEPLYKVAIDLILQLLLLQTDRMIKVENSRQKLFTRITQVMLGVNLQYYRRMRPIKILDDVLEPLKSYRNKVECTNKPWAKIIGTNLSSDLISLIESIKPILFTRKLSG